MSLCMFNCTQWVTHHHGVLGSNAVGSWPELPTLRLVTRQQICCQFLQAMFRSRTVARLGSAASNAPCQVSTTLGVRRASQRTTPLHVLRTARLALGCRRCPWAVTYVGRFASTASQLGAAVAPTSPMVHAAGLSPPLPQDLVPAVFVEVYPGANGVYSMTVPLPVVGVRQLSLDPNQTVNDVVATVKALVGETTRVRLRSPSGAKLAGSTPVHSFIGSPWRLDLDGYVIGAGSARDSVASVFSRAELGLAFARLRNTLLELDSPRISVPTFEMMCKEALDECSLDAAADVEPMHGARSASPTAADRVNDVGDLSPEQLGAICRRWKLILEEEGVLLHFAHAVEDELRHTVFVQPNLTGDVIAALDVDGVSLRQEIESRRAEVASLEEQIAKLQAMRVPAEKGAHRFMNSMCYLATVGMVGQFSWLAHRVYVCWTAAPWHTIFSPGWPANRYTVSWDVMEPFIYFLDMGYVMLFYLFFLRTSKDPNFDNIFGNMYNWQLTKRLKKAGYDQEVVDGLSATVDSKVQELNVLYSRVGRS